MFRLGLDSGKREIRGFRPDIEGLRAVAVLGVVIYHARAGLLPGGYTGVDVFFVVSGYLITGLLWRERTRAGRLSMAGFYARRARRLLPAAMVVIVATALAARRLLPPLAVPAVLKDGLTSALYVGNYRFAIQRTDYLNASAAPSPFQHFWSLGVEEQFYLLWPLLLIGAALAARTVARRTSGAHVRRVDRSRSYAMAAMATLSSASFAASLWLTSTDQPWAFFSLPTRAWELGVGGILALAAPVVRRMAGRPAAALGWAGIASVAAGMWLIGPTVAFPGWAACIPVAGTLAVLASGEALRVGGLGRFGRLGRRGAPVGPGAVLSIGPARYVGRISYSWYLWHWPFLILAPYALGHPLSLPASLAVAVMSGAVAAASFHLIEAPARTWTWLAGRPRRSLLSGLSASAAGVMACLGLTASVPALTGQGTAHAVTLADPQAGPDQTGAASSSAPPLSPAQRITAQVQALIAASVGTEQIPANLTPSLHAARTDEPEVMVDGCMDPYPDQSVRTCAFGDTTSQTKIALFGDSHAASWFPAVEGDAARNGWEVLNLAKAVCPPFLLPIYSPDLGRNFYECENWRQSALTRLRAEHPTLVILAMARHYTSIYGWTPYSQTWNDALAQMVSTIESFGSKVLVIGPVPKPNGFVPDCLSAHIGDAAACTVATDVAIDHAGETAEEAAVKAAGASYLDVRPWFCTPSTCAVIAGDIDMWRDDNHITDTWSRYLAPAMSASLEQILAGGT